MIGIILGVVAPAETFLYIDRLGAADVCAARGFPTIEVFGFVLRHFLLEFVILFDETGRVKFTGMTG